MSRQLQQQLEDWLLAQPMAECDGMLEGLHLVKRDSLFGNMATLARWIMGDYDPEDFEQESGQKESVEDRIKLRETFLQTIVREDNDINCKLQNAITLFGNSPQLGEEDDEREKRDNAQQERRQQDTREQEKQRQEREQREKHQQQHEERQRQNVTQRRERQERRQPLQRENARDAGHPTKQSTEEMMHVESSTGTLFAIPKDISLLLIDLICRMKAMETELSELRSARASSSRVPEERENHRHNVQFADTFTIREQSG